VSPFSTRAGTPVLHHPESKGLESMDFLSSWPVMIGMAVALLALIGVMIFLRMKPRDDE
jgi:hypothetical protein